MGVGVLMDLLASSPEVDAKLNGIIYSGAGSSNEIHRPLTCIQLDKILHLNPELGPLLDLRAGDFSRLYLKTWLRNQEAAYKAAVAQERRNPTGSKIKKLPTHEVPELREMERLAARAPRAVLIKQGLPEWYADYIQQPAQTGRAALSVARSMKGRAHEVKEEGVVLVNGNRSASGNLSQAELHIRDGNSPGGTLLKAALRVYLCDGVFF